ncbi:MAG TPA: biotin/lipoyl-containing protein, partial [Gemmatimonadaceae bacterium]|nr:biotin/lipoyl-containing protein [Gemmatimonadaceae bacterium]
MPKLVDVTVPVGQSEGTESFVSSWFKSVGDTVAENEPLLEISTDKVNMEVASPGTGRLVEILKSDGDQVEPGEVLGRLDTEVEAAASAPAEAPPAASPQADGTERPAAAQAGGSGELSPAVRKLLKEHGLEASQVAGTGKGGRITAD